MERRVSGSMNKVLDFLSWHNAVVQEGDHAEGDAGEGEEVGEEIRDEEPVRFVVVAVYVVGKLDGRVD